MWELAVHRQHTAVHAGVEVGKLHQASSEESMQPGKHQDVQAGDCRTGIGAL